MDPASLAAIALFVGTILMTRHMQRAAYETLSRDAQERAAEASANTGTRTLLVVVAGLAGYVLVKQQMPDSPLPATVFMLGLGGFYAWASWSQYQQLVGLDLPDTFIRSIRQTTIIRAAVVSGLFVVLLVLRLVG